MRYIIEIRSFLRDYYHVDIHEVSTFLHEQFGNPFSVFASVCVVCVFGCLCVCMCVCVYACVRLNPVLVYTITRYRFKLG